MVLHTNLSFSLLRVLKFFNWKIVTPLSFLSAPYPLASWSLPQNLRTAPRPSMRRRGPRIYSNARGQYTVQTDDLKWRLRSLLNAWDGRGDYLFLALHHPVETSHILREACCPFGHQTVSEGERESTPLPISWVLSSSIYMVAERT